MASEEELATADAVSTELIRLMRLLERGRAQYQADHPDAVERATYLLLVHLVKGGPRRAGALAEAVHSDPSTISRQIGHLVKLGLVERTADPVDGRATLLAATTEGLRVFEENRTAAQRDVRADPHGLVRPRPRRPRRDAGPPHDLHRSRRAAISARLPACLPGACSVLLGSVLSALPRRP